MSDLRFRQMRGATNPEDLLRLWRRALHLVKNKADVAMLGEALTEFYAEKSPAGLDGYSKKALGRIWKAERFSWWMTSLLHTFPETGAFGRRIQRADFDYLSGSRAAQTSLAENYTGLSLGT